MTKLRASTLAEMLVVILVSAVVLAAVMDGMGIFGRYTSGLAVRIGEGSRFRESYYLLEHMTSTADSLTEEEGRIAAWRGGQQAGVLYQRDSLLLVLRRQRTDTLFSGLASFVAYPLNREGQPDSLVVSLVRSGGVMNITLPVIPPQAVRTRQSIEETEENYGYD